MHVLIIGGTKFIGHKVVELLLERGHKVTVFHRGQHEDLPPGVAHIHGDKHHLTEIRETLLAGRPDVAIDMIADNDTDANQLIDVCAGRVRMVVFLSSQNVYSPWGAMHGRPYQDVPIPFPEDAPLRKELFLYRGKGGKGDTYEKILVEEAAMAAHQQGRLPACVLRLPAVYGPRDYQVREFPFIKRVLDKRPHLVLGRGANWLWQRGYIDDVAAAVVLAAEQPEVAAGEIFNVGHRQVWTVERLAQQVGKVLNREWEVVSVPDEILAPDSLLYPKMPHIVADTEKVRRVLGWMETINQAEGLRRAVEWHLEHPPDAAHLPYSFDYKLEDRVLAAYRRLLSEHAAQAAALDLDESPEAVEVSG